MPKILVLYYSAYGHVETMAEAVAEGARQVSGAAVTIKRVPELVPDEVARKSGHKLDQKAPIADPSELGDYDAAKYWYEKALAADPNHVRTWQYYGMLQVERGNMLKAAEHLEKIRQLCGSECKEYADLKSAMEGHIRY